MYWLSHQALRASVDLLLDGSVARGENYLFPDERARQRALAQLAAEPGMEANGAKLCVLSGELTITGVVGTAAMKARAEQICRATAGVVSVRNELRVR